MYTECIAGPNAVSTKTFNPYLLKGNRYSQIIDRGKQSINFYVWKYSDFQFFNFGEKCFSHLGQTNKKTVHH